jgi:hypothetical protein
MVERSYNVLDWDVGQMQTRFTENTPKQGETCKCENVLNNTNDYFGVWILARNSMEMGFSLNLS